MWQDVVSLSLQNTGRQAYFEHDLNTSSVQVCLSSIRCWGRRRSKPLELLLLLQSWRTLCFSAACQRIVFPLSQPAPQQPQSACRAGSESNLYPRFVLVSFQVECASLLEALVQLLPLSPSGELFNCCQLGKFVFCLCKSFSTCGWIWTF